MKKRIISLFLAIMMIVSVIPTMEMTAFAETSGDFEYTVLSETEKTCKIKTYKGTTSDLIIPSHLDGYTVISIGIYAFYKCTSLTSTTIPNSVTSIENYAFEDCTSLTSITIPNSVTSIGVDAFSNTAYYNNTSNWEIDELYGTHDALYIGNCLIKVKDEFVDYSIKDGTRLIADCAFKNSAAYSNLKSVTIPNSVICIGNSAFYNCKNLTSINIPNSVTSIGNSAFYNCQKLKDITIPDSVTSIGGQAFYCCASLSSIIIPDSATITDTSELFYSCISLTSVILPDSVTSIGDSAFYNCKNLTSVIIPNSVTSIGYKAFKDCVSLKRIVIPDSVMEIGYYAFDNTAYYNTESNWENYVLYICNHLISAKKSLSGAYSIKQGTKTIAIQAFYDCDSLTSIIIPNSISILPHCAFESCSNLQNITIPNSIVEIISAFYCCNSLKDIYFDGNEKTFNKILLTAQVGDKDVKIITKPIGEWDSKTILEQFNNATIHYATITPVITSISIATQPSKKTYYIGDSLNTSGLQLNLTYSDGSTETVSSGYTVSGFSSTTAGAKTVTVNYEGLTTTFNVTVNTPSLSLSASSQTLTVGDKTTLTATTTPSGQSVNWSSSDTSVASVSNGVITAKSSGTATITAKFTYNGKTYSKNCNVTVNNPPATVSSISIQSRPTKTVYTVGETFSSSGIVVKVNMSDGTSKTVTSGFTVSAPNMSTAGTKTVTVTYEGKTATFNITVNKPVSPTSAKYKISGATATAGSTVEVYVSIENNPGIISLRNQVAYDTSVLELVKVEDLKLLSGYTTPSPTVNSPYTLRWADSLATQNNKANGNFVKLTFKIKDDAKAGDYGISVSHIESRTATGEKVEFADCSAVITVIDYIIGDVDGNGEVDDWDAIVLNRYLAGWQTEANLVAADMDGDGELTDWDAIALERRLAGWDV